MEKKRRGREKLKLLYITNMYPSPTRPRYGIFIYDQIQSLVEKGVDAEVWFIDSKSSSFAYFAYIIKKLEYNIMG